MGTDTHIANFRLMYAYNDWANTRVLNHAMQHRSEVAHMLTQHGLSPGELDVMWFIMPADGSDRVPGV